MEALQRAAREQKPILVSIGYAACHWCHVMERESFEDEAIAAVMNRYFVCIKVDREERPDVDAVYMDAVQALGVGGGWPLHAFLLPDQRPFFGGTYFKPEAWKDLLERIGAAFQDWETYGGQLEESAQRLMQFLSISPTERLKPQASADFDPQALRQMADHLEEQFDTQNGGLGHAPKFPMPTIYVLLLRIHALAPHAAALAHVMRTLDAMARGGIYDQIGGGFARYSVTPDWHVPHFEKMLYDNAQLLSLYAEAFQCTSSEEYRRILEQTIAFIAREMTAPEGGFFSALDADSEGEEGKFYLWDKSDIFHLLPPEEAELCCRYYNITTHGNWHEAQSNILQRQQPDQAFAQAHQLTLPQLYAKVDHWQRVLMQARAKRIRPATDDKILTDWNGLAIKGLVDAHLAIASTEALTLAQNAARFLCQTMFDPSTGKLLHTYRAGKAHLAAYLDDYAFLTQGLLALYQVDFDPQWLQAARQLTAYALENFNDPKEVLLFFTDQNADPLITRRKEFFDNVTPAANSVMAQNLFWLSFLDEQPGYQERAQAMLAQVLGRLPNEPRYLSNWGVFYTLLAKPIAEVAIVGPDALAYAQAIGRVYHPHKVLDVSILGASRPMLEGRTSADGRTYVHVCQNRTCRLPLTDLSQSIHEILSL